jgi:hypothetical protein
VVGLGRAAQIGITQQGRRHAYGPAMTNVSVMLA